jgi:acyl-CoA thioesterase-1
MAKKKRFKMTGAVWQLVGLGVLAIVTFGVVVSVILPGKSAAGTAQPVASPAPTKTVVKQLRVAFIGDSYTAGAGATNQNGWVRILSQRNDWGLINLGRGGTGYLKAIPTGGVNACGVESCPNYLAMVDKAVEAKPDVVIVSGGRNDGSLLTQDLASIIPDVFGRLRAGLPDAKIVALNPIWAAESPQPDASAFTDAVRAGASSVGGTFVSIGTPFAGRPELITKDNVHPNDAGHQHLATVTGEALAAAKLP